MERNVIVGRAFYVVVWLGGGEEIQISKYFLNAISFFLAAFGSAGSAYAVVAENSSKGSRHTSRTASHFVRHTADALIETFRSWNAAVFRPATSVVFGACYFCWFGTADGDWNMVQRRIYLLTSHHTAGRQNTFG
jgi:L-fucose isomerase-like protein